MTFNKDQPCLTMTLDSVYNMSLWTIFFFERYGFTSYKRSAHGTGWQPIYNESKEVWNKQIWSIHNIAWQLAWELHSGRIRVTIGDGNEGTRMDPKLESAWRRRDQRRTAPSPVTSLPLRVLVTVILIKNIFFVLVLHHISIIIVIIISI